MVVVLLLVFILSFRASDGLRDVLPHGVAESIVVLSLVGSNKRSL